jgi:hypothetical protein
MNGILSIILSISDLRSSFFISWSDIEAHQASNTAGSHTSGVSEEEANPYLNFSAKILLIMGVKRTIAIAVSMFYSESRNSEYHVTIIITTKLHIRINF